MELKNKQVHHLPSAARALKLKGVGDGSAYRSHPCWVRRGQFLIVDHWHTDNHCHISLITEPDAIVRAGCNDSRGSGNPFPVVDKGELVGIWSCGSWTMDGPWQADVLAMVEELEAEIKEARQQIEAEQAAESQKRAQEKLGREEAIRQQYQASQKESLA